MSTTSKYVGEHGSNTQMRRSASHRAESLAARIEEALPAWRLSLNSFQRLSGIHLSRQPTNAPSESLFITSPPCIRSKLVWHEQSPAASPFQASRGKWSHI